MNWGRAIKIVRTVRGLPQRELSKLVGCDPSYVSLIEKGKRIPSTAVMETIAKVTGVPMCLLIILSSSEEEFDRLDDETRGIIGGWFLKVVMGKYVNHE